jgi:NAD(P)-dependent dehydrogenase (short-subunit alcohol dehydrogenase family)
MEQRTVMENRCLVLVGAGDIAVASALELWRRGYDTVYVLTRGRSETSRAASGRLEDAGFSAVPLVCDVSDWESIADAAARITHPIGALVYSPAGERVFRELEQLTQDEWDQSLDVFVGGFVGTVKALLPRIDRGTSIVALSGTSARMVASSRHLAMGSSKAALEHAVAYLADALAERGTRVNGVSCGPVETSSTRATMDDAAYEQLRGWQSALTVPGRLGQPADVGRVVSALCSPDFDWVSGQVLLADGGALTRSGAGGGNPLNTLLEPHTSARA